MAHVLMIQLSLVTLTEVHLSDVLCYISDLLLLYPTKPFYADSNECKDYADNAKLISSSRVIYATVLSQVNSIQ